MRDYNIWYWTEGPGKGSGVGSGAPAGASTGLPDPPPLAPPVPISTPPVIEPAKPPPVEQTFVNWGKVIPISMGMRRMSPQIIWLKAPVLIGVTVKADFAQSWGYNADDNPDDTTCTALYANGTKIWTIGDGNLLPGSWSWEWYPGTETQGKDPTMVADKGASNTPAYRNQMYGVFKNFPLEKFGFKLPGISAEIMGSGSEAPRKDSWNPEDKHPLVVLETPWTISKYVPTGYPGSPEWGNQFTPAGVRSRTFHKRGQYYFEITADNLWKGAWYGFAGYLGVGAGIVTKMQPLTTPAGWQAEGAGAAVPAPYTSLINPGPGADLYRTATAGLGGYSVEGPPEWNAGETMGLHINMTAGYIRARNVSANSAWTNTLYYTTEAHPDNPDITMTLGDALYAYANVNFGPESFLVTYSDRQTVNFGAQPFKGAIPAGATAWNGTGGADVFLGTLPLKDFISKIAIYTGLDPNADLDFVDIDDIIHGGVITNDTEFRSFLTVLGRAYGFDYYEGDVIRIVRRVVQATYSIDKVIPPEDLLNDTDRAITTTRRKDDSPNEIELNYMDVTQQFRWNLQKARRILFPVKTTELKRKDSFSIPIVTTANDALTMAGKAMYREAAQNIDHEAKLTSKHFGIEPSDILTITAADTEYTVKVAQVNIEEDMRITLKAVNLLTDEDMYFDAEAGEPALPYAGNRYFLAAEEGADRMVASQLIGTMWAYEGEDTAAFRVVTLALAATDRPDTFAGAQFVSTLAATDRPDTLSGVGGTVDPNFGQVVFLSGFNGTDGATTAVDEATSKAITFNGNAQIDTAQFKFGVSSLLLDGTGDYLSLADHADWDFGAGQFTVECWVRPTTGFGTNEAFVGQWSSTAANCAWFFFVESGALTWRHRSSGGVVRSVAASWSPTLDTWYHLAVTRDASGVIRIYINGSLLTSNTFGDVINNSTATLTIGVVGGFVGTYDLNGWIDEVRITKGIARYTTGFTAPTAAFPRS